MVRLKKCSCGFNSLDQLGHKETSSQERRFTPPAITDFDSGTPSRYGFGILVWPGRLIGHGGANFGYNTVMDYQEGYYYSILVNAGTGIVSPDGTKKTGSVMKILADVQSVVPMS